MRIYTHSQDCVLNLCLKQINSNFIDQNTSSVAINRSVFQGVPPPFLEQDNSLPATQQQATGLYH
jgi:hypothetical protein